MSEFTGLPIGVPTKTDDNGDVETWKTRTGQSESAGEIEYRPKPGGPTAVARAREVRLAAAAATLRQWAADARATNVTAGNAVATLQVVVNRFGALADNLADLLQSFGDG